MNMTRKSKDFSTFRAKTSKRSKRNKKSVSHQTQPDKKNQTKRLLTKAERELIAEYQRHAVALFPVRKKRAA